MLKKLKELENLLLGRKRITYEIGHTGAPTPSRQSLADQISQDLKIDNKLIVVRHIFSKFGVNTSKVIAHVYNDEERMNFLEMKREKKAKPAG